MRKVEFTDTARRTDRELARIDGKIDWLSRLTPTNIVEVREEFENSGYRKMPPLAYDELPYDLDALKDELTALPIEGVASSDIEALLLEKQRELDRQIQVVRLRDRKGFVMAAIDLFGNVSDRLLASARKVLDTVPTRDGPTERDVDAKAFIEAGRREMAAYRAKDERFDFDVVEEPVPGTHIFTSSGNLHVACDYRCPEERVDPLLQHEIGTHTVTRFNGRCQPLAILECGLADYDALQEGVAVLSEYLAGNMPPSRLRVLAARVVAARMAIDGEAPGDIYAAMRDEACLDAETAFDTMVRAMRGGGMTKDALYLDGLIDLLAYLANGGDVAFLFIGKFALKQRIVLERLLADGFLQPPTLIPPCFANPDALADIRRLKVEQFYKESTPA